MAAPPLPGRTRKKSKKLILKQTGFLTDESESFGGKATTGGDAGWTEGGLGGLFLDGLDAPLAKGQLEAPELELLSVKTETGGRKLDLADSHEALDEALKPNGVGVGADFAHGVEETDRSEGGRAFGNAGAIGDSESAGLAGEVTDLLEMVTVVEPVLIATLAPLKEAAHADGAAVEPFREDGTDLGESIEPSDDGLGGAAIGEALVDLLAEFFGELSDFTVARHKGKDEG
jgi:hypothetical protein